MSGLCRSWGSGPCGGQPAARAHGEVSWRRDLASPLVEVMPK